MDLEIIENEDFVQNCDQIKKHGRRSWEEDYKYWWKSATDKWLKGEVKVIVMGERILLHDHFPAVGLNLRDFTCNYLFSK